MKKKQTKVIRKAEFICGDANSLVGFSFYPKACKEAERYDKGFSSVHISDCNRFIEWRMEHNKAGLKKLDRALKVLNRIRKLIEEDSE